MNESTHLQIFYKSLYTLIKLKEKICRGGVFFVKKSVLLCFFKYKSLIFNNLNSTHLVHIYCKNIYYVFFVRLYLFCIFEKIRQD